MSIIGNYYYPVDNSFCINCRTGRKALIVQEHDKYYSPDKEEDGADFKIVSEPYVEEIYFCGLHSDTFVNVQSLKTGNIYRTLFVDRGVL